MSSGKYDDIIDYQYSGPKNHPRMSRLNRAAQFAPFAALIGHHAALQETARCTDRPMILDDSKIEELNRKIAELMNIRFDRPVISVTYFLADNHKSGGSYEELSGELMGVDEYGKKLILSSGEIPFETIVDIQ